MTTHALLIQNLLKTGADLRRRAAERHLNQRLLKIGFGSKAQQSQHASGSAFSPPTYQCGHGTTPAFGISQSSNLFSSTPSIASAHAPSVGEACHKYGSLFRQGLYISLTEKGIQVLQVLKNWPQRGIQVILVTDGELILGLGCQGMGIPVGKGKFSLYTALGGIRPSACLPITIDVGTNNDKLLSDEFYIGHQQPRATGQAGTAITELIALKISKETGAPISETRKMISLVDYKGLIVSSRKESLQHFNQPWSHEHKPVKDLIGAVNAIRPQGLYATKGIGQPAFGPSFGLTGPGFGQFRGKTTNAGNYLTSDSFVDATRVIGPSVVILVTPRGLHGAGVILSKSGTIITCADAVIDQDILSHNKLFNRRVFVTLQGDTKEISGTIVGYDSNFNLAKVVISYPNLVPAKFGDSRRVRLGELVLSVGNPDLLSHTFTMGVISCVSRTTQELQIRSCCKEFIQSDCALNQGSTGGPLTNLKGEVIGINSIEGRGLSIALAIPSNTVLRVKADNKW